MIQHKRIRRFFSGSVAVLFSLGMCFLNDLTEKATGKKVIALPIEATAIGNLKIQLNVK